MNTTKLQILKTIDKFKRLNTTSSRTVFHQKIENIIDSAISNNQQIKLILPAFPCKSANRNKTSGNLPDYGEYHSLKHLQSLCSAIKNIYQPGAKITICSDGRVFSDLVLVTVIHFIVVRSKYDKYKTV